MRMPPRIFPPAKALFCRPTLPKADKKPREIVVKILADVHLHTTFCDGKNTVREMADAALRLGFTDLGFSEHAPSLFDPQFPGMADPAAYRAEVNAVKKALAGQLAVSCGVEQDFYAPVQREEYDYVIGSVHYVQPDKGVYRSVDSTLAELQDTVNRYYGGDVLALMRNYYENCVENARTLRPDIMGHFDVALKHNESGCLLDENSTAYRGIALEAADAVADYILPYGGIVEVNTGAIARGYRSTPYPADFLLRHLAQRGVRVMLTGDAHSASSLCFAFDKALAIVREAGFQQLALLRDGRFADVAITD